MSNYELIKSKLAQSNSYLEYFDQFKKKAESNDFSILSETDKEHFTYIKLNLQRSSRIHKTFKPSEKIKNFISKIINE